MSISRRQIDAKPTEPIQIPFRPFGGFLYDNVANLFMIGGLTLMVWMVLAGWAAIVYRQCDGQIGTCTGLATIPGAVVAGALLGLSISTGINLIGRLETLDRKKHFNALARQITISLAIIAIPTNWNFYHERYALNFFPGLLSWLLVAIVLGGGMVMFVQRFKVTSGRPGTIPILVGSWAVPFTLAHFYFRLLPTPLHEERLLFTVSLVSALAWMFTSVLGTSVTVWLISNLPEKVE